MKKAKLSDFAIYVLLGGIYAASLSLIVMRATIIAYTNVRVVVYTLLFLIAFTAAFYNIFTTLATAAAALFFYLPDMKGINKYITDLFWFIRGYQPFEERFVMGVTIFVCATAAVYICVFLIKFFNFYLLALLGVAVLVFQFSGGYILSGAAFAFFQASFLALAAMKLNQRGKTRNVVFTLCFLPVCCVLAFGAYYASGRLMEYGEDVGRIPGIVDDFVYFCFNPKYYSFKSTGFGSNGKLGGKVSPSDRYVMDVYANGRPYLAGAVKTIYTGETWENGFIKIDGAFDRNLFEMDYYEAFQMENGDFFDRLNEELAKESGLLRHKVIKFSDVVITDEVTVTGSRISTLFRPGWARAPSVDGRRELLMSPLGDLLAVPPMSRNDSYAFTYLFPDYNDEYLQNYLRENNAVDDLPVPPECFMTPLSLPDRVGELAREIAGPFDNNYDKVKALERYVSQFPYTLSPRGAPAGEDFVDYFLFEVKQGYCTYYASALAVMARCVGLPSRYVEGYCMPPSKTDGAYAVSDRQAHAWAEVYFDNFGWVAFEATPAYSYLFYNRSSGPGGGAFAPSFFDEPDFEDYLRSYGLEDFDFLRPGADDYQIIEVHESISLITVLLYIAAGLGAALFVLAVVFAFGKMRVRIKWARLRKQPINERTCGYFKSILKLAAYFDYPILRCETPEMYAARLGKRFTFKHESIFMRDLTRIYYKSAYGGKPLPDSDAAAMEECFLEFKDHIFKIRSHPLSRLKRFFFFSDI